MAYRKISDREKAFRKDIQDAKRRVVMMNRDDEDWEAEIDACDEYALEEMEMTTAPGWYLFRYSSRDGYSEPVEGCGPLLTFDEEKKYQVDVERSLNASNVAWVG